MRLRLRHLQWAVVVLAIVMAVGFPAFRRGRRAHASATILVLDGADEEPARILSRPVLRDALFDPLYHLADRPVLKGATDPERALAAAIQVSPRPGTNMIVIAAVADARDDAAAIVDAVLVAYLRTRPTASVQVLDSTSSIPAAWYRPHFAAYVLVMIAGFTAAVAWIALLIHLAQRIRRHARMTAEDPAPWRVN